MNDRVREVRKALGLSQDEFAKRLGLTRGAITNIELGKVEPKPLLVDLICKEYRVNEEWMRYGTGDMFVHLNRQQKIAQFSADLFRSEEESFKSRLIMALAELDEEDWVVLEKIAKKIAKKD